MRDIKRYFLLNAQSSTGESEQIYCGDYRNAVVSLGAATGTTATVKIKGGIIRTSSTGAELYPDLSAATTATNQWDYVQSVDLEDGAGVNGDDGISWANSADSRLVEVNINSLDFFSVEVSSISAGSITAFVTLTDNQ